LITISCAHVGGVLPYPERLEPNSKVFKCLWHAEVKCYPMEATPNEKIEREIERYKDKERDHSIFYLVARLGQVSCKKDGWPVFLSSGVSSRLVRVRLCQRKHLNILRSQFAGYPTQ